MAVCKLPPNSLSKKSFLLFSGEKSFWKENNQFSSQSFFPVSDFVHDAQTARRKFKELYITYVWGVTAVGKSEVEGSIPAVGHTIYIFLDAG